MKLIGFIKEHNDISESQKYTSIRGGTFHDPHMLERVVRYLGEGVLILGWMGYFLDIEDNTPISPDCYYTDGVYIWPAYFPYYLRKLDGYKINDEFLSHIAANNYRVNQSGLSEATKIKLEERLSKLLAQR